VAPHPEPICALIVDDEAPARRRLVDLLGRDPDIGTVLTAENGIAAITMIQESRPDIIFLDVQMPGVDGFGVIEAIGPEAMPLTVFVTAYDRFAIQAFDVDAVDYLLKPYGDRRYEATMTRVKQRLRDLEEKPSDGAGALGPELLKLVTQRTRPGALWEWIAVKRKDTTRLLMVEDIEWIEAAGVYVTLHAKGEQYLYRAALAAVAGRLDPFRFVRVHRSSIVNVTAIDFLERRSHGEFEIALKNGTRLMMSRTYRDDVEAILGQPL
jgi:two-component system, LytTR family, response regulator